MRMALKPLILVTAPWGTNCPDLTSTLNAFLREVFKNKEPARVTSPRKPCPLTNTSLRRGCCAARESGANMAALILSDTLMCLSCSRLRRPSRPRGAEQWPETCWRGGVHPDTVWHGHAARADKCYWDTVNSYYTTTPPVLDHMVNKTVSG